jgi:ankyrin repeat protein
VLAVVLGFLLLSRDPAVDMAVEIERGDLEAVTKLLEGGVSANLALGEGEAFSTPLQRAAWNGRTEIASLLLDHGADVNTTSPTYGSALHAACARGWDDLAQVLLDRGAEVDMRDARGNRPLVSAVSQGNRDLTTLLLKAGAKVEEAGEGYTPLMYAATSGDAEMIRLLVRAGAKVNGAAKGQYGGMNPLLIAAERGELEAVKTLLELKANPNARTTEGESALALAKKGGFSEVETALKTAGAIDGKPAGRKP